MKEGKLQRSNEIKGKFPNIRVSQILLLVKLKKKFCCQKESLQKRYGFLEIYRQEAVSLFNRGLDFLTEMPLYSLQKSNLHRKRQKSQGVPKE